MRCVSSRESSNHLFSNIQAPWQIEVSKRSQESRRSYGQTHQRRLRSPASHDVSWFGCLSSAHINQDLSLIRHFWPSIQFFPLNFFSPPSSSDPVFFFFRWSAPYSKQLERSIGVDPSLDSKIVVWYARVNRLTLRGWVWSAELINKTKTEEQSRSSREIKRIWLSRLFTPSFRLLLHPSLCA